MKQINPSQKVADVLKDHPHTVQVFLQHGCPDLRKGFFSLMARVMSVRNAARIHGISPEQLVADLETAVNHPQD